MISDRKVDFIGIGAMRCATTWISRCIEYHPELYIPSGKKEIHYFDRFRKQKPHGKKERWNYKKGNRWYENHFNQAQTNQLIGEYTPNYLSDSQSASLIYEHYPQTKLILSLRNPAERAFSHYQYVKRNHKGIPDDFETALAESNVDHQFLELGLYGKYLQEYLKYFPRDQILILYYGDIKSNPHAACKSLYDFLGVEDRYIPPIISQKINSSRSVKHPGLLRSMRKIKQIIKELPWLRRSIETVGGVQLGRWINKQNRAKESGQRPEIHPETAAFLKLFYQEDLDLLETLTGEDLSSWK